MAEGRDDRLRYAREGLRRDKFGHRRAPRSKAALIGSTNATWEKAQAHIRELEEEVKLLKNLSHHNIVKRYLGTVREEDTLNILLDFIPNPQHAAVRLSPLRPPCRRRELLCYLLPISATRFSRPDPEQGVNKLVLEASPSCRKDNCSRHRRRRLWSSTPLPSCMRACSMFSIQDYANGELCQTRRYDDYAYMPRKECGEMVVSKAMSLLLRLQLEMYLVQMVIIVLKARLMWIIYFLSHRFHHENSRNLEEIQGLG